MTFQIDKKRSIGQAAKEIGVQEHVIRFWETQFDEIQPTIGSGNRRYFYDRDIKILKIIKYYLYEKGFTIKGLQKILRDEGINIDTSDIEFSGNLVGNDRNNTNGKSVSNAYNTGLNAVNHVNSSEKYGENKIILNKNIDEKNNNLENDFSDKINKKNNSKFKDNLKSLKIKLNIFYEKLKSI